MRAARSGLKVCLRLLLVLSLLQHQEYDGAKVITKIDGKRVVTPLLIVMIAIGSTDILFAR